MGRFKHVFGIVAIVLLFGDLVLVWIPLQSPRASKPLFEWHRRYYDSQHGRYYSHHRWGSESSHDWHTDGWDWEVRKSELDKWESDLRKREAKLEATEREKADNNLFSARLTSILAFLGLLSGAIQMIVYTMIGLRSVTRVAEKTMRRPHPKKAQLPRPVLVPRARRKA